MQAAHEQQIMHGNLRPSNVLFDDKKQLKITDFGFEKHYNNQIEKSWYQPDHKNLQPVQKDIYSAGAIFFHMLTGAPATLKLGQLQSNSSFEALDSRVQHLVKNMIETQSINRYESFAEILPELQKLQQVTVKRAAENKTPAFKLSHFFLILIILNLLAGVIYYFLNPAFSDYLNSIIKQLNLF
jgi:eukaryotic-like serine/threonine-protein kinase